MGRTSRKRSKLANRAIAATAALVMGGGGLIAANSYASAGQGWWPGGKGDQQQNRARTVAGQPVSTIDCPDVGNSLQEVPDDQRFAVDRELATLDTQITTSYQRLAENKQRVVADRSFGENQILAPLRNERLVIIQRIVALIDRSAERPQGLEAMAPCTLRNDDAGNNNGNNGGGGNNNGGNDNGQGNGQGNGQNGGQNGGDNGDGQNGGGGGFGGQAGNGPVAGDFVNI
ncbi:hypothetical protein ABZ457_27580, partial [Streptomyces sp. NPDC005805]